MRVTSCAATNFGSHLALSMEVADRGLVLIQGPTGSGKSTMCDVIPWVLFGRTAKDGAVDEVKNWDSEAPTMASVRLDDGTEIVRSRSKHSDLYYKLKGSDEPVRGKDIADTQCKVHDILGCSIELYLSGSYFHEFSQTAQFFTATAKNRRAMCEQIVDMALPMLLEARVKTRIKEIKTGLAEAQDRLKITRNTYVNFARSQETEKTKHETWRASHAAEVEMTKSWLRSWDLDKNRRLRDLNRRYEKDLAERRRAMICPECGSARPANPAARSPVLEVQIAALLDEVNPNIRRLSDLEATKNPHDAAVKDYQAEIDKALREAKCLEAKIVQLEEGIIDLDALLVAAARLRSLLVENAIRDVEYRTNDVLTRFFDGEIHVDLAVSLDRLDVVMYKDGHACAFTQLSKGQRQLLKLCFGVAMMQSVSNHSGVRFHQVFIDEATDGLSEDLKIKVYGLLEHLAQEYESVFLVEHSSELKARFSNQIEVQLVDGVSQIKTM